jgi:excisionase family DNA binding protein
MKKMSDKARKRYQEAKPVRDALRAEVGRCEITGATGVPLDVHEICRGVNRSKALDKRFALLVVCRLAHEELGSASKWPEARQLAWLAERRLYDFDLKAYLELTSPRAPNRITLEEVVEHMSDELFKVEEVAVRLRVNRRTAQSWIDSKELPAIDVRPDGAQRAMWRVKPEDLLRFVQDRKSKESL